MDTLVDSDDWFVKRTGLRWQVFRLYSDGFIRETACGARFWRRLTAERVRLALFVSYRNAESEHAFARRKQA